MDRAAPTATACGATIRPEMSARLGACLAVGGIALALVFLGYHRAELAGACRVLWALTAVFAHHGVFRLSEVAPSAAGAVIAGLIVTAWYGAGDLLLRRSARSENGVPADILSLARTTAFGAGLWSLAWFLLGITGFYTTATAVMVLALGIGLGAAALMRCGRVARGPFDADSGRRGPATISSTIVIVALAAGLIAALAPPTAKDTLQYHMALPRTFTVTTALVPVPNNIASYYPLAVEMQGLWAMLVGRGIDVRVGEAAFGAVVFTFFPLLLAIVYGWARRAGVERAWSLAAVAIVASVPTVYDVAASAYVDLALGVYVALAVEAVSRWWVTPDVRHLVHLALAIGFALAVKLLALVPLLLVAGLLLARVLMKRGDAALLRLRPRSVAALAAAVALGSPWYIRTWAGTGSPLFPFYLDVWPASADGWDVERSVLLGTSINQYGPADAVMSALSPILVSLSGWREIPALYEGALGPAFLVGVVLVILAVRRRRLQTELVVAAAAGAALVVWWTLSAQLLRYMLPALAPLAVASAGAAAALARGGVRGVTAAVMAPVAAGLVVLLTWFVADAPMLPVLGTETRDEYLARRLDYYPYYRLVNETLPRDARVWLIDMRRDTYHLERPYFADYFFEDHTLRRWVMAATSPAELQARAREAGISHVLVRHDVLFDYTRSVLVDDARPREENLARLRLARAFLVEGTTVLRADAKFLLAALPPAR